MKKFIAPGGVLVILMGLILILVFMEYAALDIVQRYTKVSDVRCGVKSWSKDSNNYLQMDLACGDNDEKKTVNDTNVIIAYLKNPVESLSCTVWASNSVTCEEPAGPEPEKK